MYKLSYVIRVSAPDLDELKRRCDEVKDFYDDLNVKPVSYTHLTGDNTNLYGLLALLLTSGAGLAGIFFYKRRKMKKS